jgi:hypothetical protein
VWYENGKPALILTIAADTIVPPVLAFDRNGKPVKAGTAAFRESAAALIPDELITNTAIPENPWSSPDCQETVKRLRINQLTSPHKTEASLRSKWYFRVLPGLWQSSMKMLSIT